MITKKTVLFMLIGVITTGIYAQKDSAKIEYSQEKITTTNKFDEAICDMLTKRENDEKDVWKINLLGTLRGAFDISYERRITKKWSCNIRSVSSFPKFSFVQSDRNDLLVFDFRNRSRFKSFNQSLSFELRHYNNLKRRERLGKKTGFSGNYFVLDLRNRYSLESGYGNPAYHFVGGYGHEDPAYGYGGYDHFGNYREEWLYHYLTLGYGIQCRIGKVGYVDANVGMGMFFKYGHATSVDHNSVGHKGITWERAYGYYQYVGEVMPAINGNLGIGIAF